MRPLKSAALFGAMTLGLLLAIPAQAGTIRVMTSGGFRAALDHLVPLYEKKTGNTVILIQGPSMGLDDTAIPNRLKHGEPGDLAIMVRSALDRLVASGAADANVADLGIGRVGMAVKAGAPKPDISTVAAFRKTLLAAKSVAYSDSASGVYIQTKMFKAMGIEDQMKPKSRMIQATPVGILVAKGDYELGFQQLSELKPVPGIDVVGTIPESVQLITPFTAGYLKHATNPTGARDLVKFLQSPAAYDAIRATGMEPAQEKK